MYNSPTTATEAALSNASRNQKKKNKRRFSDRQIEQLESMFESESRPQLRTKQELANKTGLHPRQVAIWFQNKRSRSKPKQVEQRYQRLKISYDTLASKFNYLKKENQCLLTQLQRLRNLMGNPQGRIDCRENAETKHEPEEKANHETGVTLCGSENVEYFGEEFDVLKLEEQPNDSLIQSGNWSSFESSCLPDYSSFESSCLPDYSGCSHWWDC
ncbi:homeobox-leucine zipper protein ATHB-12-like [Cornus florida]|uniref:homeobox-leucine zipper protein ATHB-12-like n=1 Tax=Cornus florida TaxID=4283 RepID=UPI0028984594|nr:homeobox-leucine zipper protein ATHB-12-like [Cornus florida]